MHGNERLLDGTEGVTFVFRIGQEACQTGEMVVGQMDRALDAVMRQMSHRDAEALSSHGNGQRFKVGCRDDGAFQAVAFDEVHSNLTVVCVILTGVQDGCGIVVGRVDLNLDFFI